MSNSFASLVFYSWPLVVLLLFHFLPRSPALAWSIVSGYLLLPNGTGFDLPLVPAVDKNAMPVLSVLLALALGLGRPDAGGRGGRAATMARGVTRGRGSFLLYGLLLLALLSPLLTIVTNTEPVFAGPRVIQGLRLYDAFSLIGGLLFTLLPFLLAQRYLATPESHATLLRILVVAALAYSLPTLWEVRMSPQLHRQVYGFFPHSFAQHFRAGGWRPLVFLGHGLWLGIFLSMAVLGAISLWRGGRGGRSAKWILAALWLLVVLVLSKTLGALVITLAFLPVLLLLGVRGQLMFAGLVALIVLLYPMLRGADLVPTEAAVTLAGKIDVERADSLQFRFNNEDILLDHARAKPLAGWGGWGRNRIYDDEGNDVSVTDGAWVITIGVSGWLGYIAQFGLLCLPIVFLMFRRRELVLTPASSGLAVLMAANLADLVPNATLTPLTWLIGGALAGCLVRAPVDAPRQEEPVEEGRAGPAYSRFPVTDAPAARRDGSRDRAWK